MEGQLHGDDSEMTCVGESVKNVRLLTKACEDGRNEVVLLRKGDPRLSDDRAAVYSCAMSLSDSLRAWLLQCRCDVHSSNHNSLKC